MQDGQCGDHPTLGVDLQGSLELFGLTSLGGDYSPPITGSVFARCRSIHAAPRARKTGNALSARQVAGRIYSVFVAWRQLDRPGCRPSASQSRQLRRFGGIWPARCITLKTAVGKVYFGDNGAVRYRLLTCAAQAESASCRAVTVRERHQNQPLLTSSVW